MHWGFPHDGCLGRESRLKFRCFQATPCLNSRLLMVGRGWNESAGFWESTMGHFSLHSSQESGMIEEYGTTLKNGHDYVKLSQCQENPSGDNRSRYRHFSKGAWTFSNRDHVWRVSDCTSEALRVGYIALF
ncbi:unnamed protein product, partial [Vitis vinifera]